MFLPILLLAACSDYTLVADKTGASGSTSATGGGGPSDSATVDLPDVCEEQDWPGGPYDLSDACYEPGVPVGSFTPTVEWLEESFTLAPGDTQVMMMPAVGSLTDDDGDGDADADDVPDVVFVSYGGSVTLRAISGDDGREHWAVTDPALQQTGGVALGDLDGDGWTDVVAAADNAVKAYDASGRPMWTSPSLAGHIFNTSDNPAIADLDGDGRPEVIMGRAILDGRSGAIEGLGMFGMGGVDNLNVGTASFAADIDLDGVQEVITGNAAYGPDGRAEWTNGEPDGYPAVGNFDADDRGEIVVVGQGEVRLLDDDGRVLCRAAIPGAGNGYYGGPPTVADFDGDGEAEFAAASGSRYSVFESDCSVRWQATTQDATSGNTGSSVFDFEGDGEAEAVYGDETRLWVFAGPGGSVKLESTDHTNNTWLEYPPVVDVDGDGHAEIVVPNTAYQGTVPRQYAGITVIGDLDDTWMPTRRIWNQHAYSITNIEDDGSVPAAPQPNWLSFNNFRSGDMTAGGGYVGPDLQVDVRAVCRDECDQGRLHFWVSAANAGYVPVDTDFVVTVTGLMADGSTQVLDWYEETRVVDPGWELDAVHLVIDPVPADLVGVTFDVDGGNDQQGNVDECVEDNDEVLWLEDLCP